MPTALNNKTMNDIKDLLKEFADFLETCGEDAFYVFDNTDEAIEAFLKQREE